MAVSGSRERLCIWQTIRMSIKNVAHCRVGNTEIMRKKLWQSQANIKPQWGWSTQPQIWKWTPLKHRNNNNTNSKATEMNTMNKNATATGLIQIPETSPRVLIIVN
jgi:hypothetical protein